MKKLNSFEKLSMKELSKILGGIEDLSKVTVHKNSSSSSQVQASAYTQSNDVHFEPQSSSDSVNVNIL